MAFSLLPWYLYSQIDLFQEGLDFLTLRFEEAANVEGNPIEAYFNRYYQMLVAPYYYNMWTDWLGNSGLGERPGQVRLLVADGEELRIPGPDHY